MAHDTRTHTHTHTRASPVSVCSVRPIETHTHTATETPSQDSMHLVVFAVRASVSPRAARPCWTVCVCGHVCVIGLCVSLHAAGVEEKEVN